MDDKHALVTSITNLIKYLRHQLIVTLSPAKTINNKFLVVSPAKTSSKSLPILMIPLKVNSKPKSELRIVTMILIAELLYNNTEIKKKFC